MRQIKNNPKTLNKETEYALNYFNAAAEAVYNMGGHQLFDTTDDLKAFVQKYPGKVTYPALPDFTGSVFVRNIIYDICGYEQFLDMKADKETGEYYH